MQISSVMIVDDSDADQFINKDVIEEFDSSIVIYQAYDGQEALEQLEKLAQQPSLILLDINMPRMNGFEFLEEYSKREDKARVIAMLTSSDQVSDSQKALEYGCVDQYFLKPITVENLILLNAQE